VDVQVVQHDVQLVEWVGLHHVVHKTQEIHCRAAIPDMGDHEGSRKPRPFVAGSYNAGMAAFSPEGHRLAYQWDESGRFEVYAQQYPGPGEMENLKRGRHDGDLVARWPSALLP